MSLTAENSGRERVWRHPLALENRGVLLDVFVFLVNLILMRFLSEQFAGLLGAASAGDVAAQYVLFLFVAGLFFLLPAGAILKRWQYHRTRATGENESERNSALNGCLFNPVLYLSLSLILFSVIQAFYLQFLYGDNDQDHPAVFIGSIFLGIALSILNTYFVFRYFRKPKRDPAFNILKSRAAASLGDICIFLNMLFFQLVWSLLAVGRFPRPSSLSEFVGRAGVLLFIALLIYFPARMFYLVDDIHKRRTWLTILIANLPIMVRVLFGSGGKTIW